MVSAAFMAVCMTDWQGLKHMGTSLRKEGRMPVSEFIMDSCITFIAQLWSKHASNLQVPSELTDGAADGAAANATPMEED